MARYTLTDEGWSRYKRTKIRMEMEEEGAADTFVVLDYLYDHGAATPEEIRDKTGLPYEQVMAQIEDSLAWDYISRMAD